MQSNRRTPEIWTKTAKFTFVWKIGLDEAFNSKLEAKATRKLLI